MKELIKKSFDFIRKNPTIIFSLFLIIAVTAIIFFNSYFILNQFQKTADDLIISKAVSVEGALSALVVEFMPDRKKLEEKIREVKEKDSGILEISVLVPREDKETFDLLASTDAAGGQIGEIKDKLYFLAWQEKNGIAHLDSSGGERLWNTVKAVKNEEGEKAGLLSFKYSLAEHDNFVMQSIQRSYSVALLSILVVLLLVINHTRLFKYAVRAAKLEEVDKMKDEFIAMASHELKSPLASIRGYIDLLRAEWKKEGRGESEHCLKNMDSSAVRLNDLVTDILDVSRIEQNRLPIVMAKINIVEIISEVLEEIKVNADKKGLQIIYEGSGNTEVLADGKRAKQILVNLLSNAVKYSSKGKIEIKLREEDAYVYIIVSDSGMGISAEAMQKLFTKFYRVSGEKTSQIPGTGLGLWISREIARKMGGDLVAQSMEDVGSQFTLKVKKA